MNDSKYTVITSEENRWLPNFRDHWVSRHLIRALIIRNLNVRYRNTILGPTWIILQPVLQMAVYTIIFGIWARIDSGGIPFAVHLMTGLILVIFTTRIIGESSTLIRSYQPIIQKVYVPKLALIYVVVGSALFDFILSIFIMAFFAMLFGVYPGENLHFALIAILLTILLSISFAIWFAALGIRYGDVSFIVPVVGMLITYLSPMIYPITMVPDQYLDIYALNPMVGIMTFWRWGYMGLDPFYPWMLAVSIIQIIVFTVTGLIYFSRTEKTFNDFL